MRPADEDCVELLDIFTLAVTGASLQTHLLLREALIVQYFAALSLELVDLLLQSALYFGRLIQTLMCCGQFKSNFVCNHSSLQLLYYLL